MPDVWFFPIILVLSELRYQLGVIATVRRPPDLDHAETLLRAVLEKQRGEGAAYAATLQQVREREQLERFCACLPCTCKDI